MVGTYGQARMAEPEVFGLISFWWASESDGPECSHDRNPWTKDVIYLNAAGMGRYPSGLVGP